MKMALLLAPQMPQRSSPTGELCALQAVPSQRRIVPRSPATYTSDADSPHTSSKVDVVPLLTGTSVVDMVISDLAVLARPSRGAPFKLIELAPGVSLDELRQKTEGHFEA